MTRRQTVPATALGALLALIAAVSFLSPRASAEQASQPASSAAGQLDAGRFHSCAILPSAALRCWGYGGDGALGYGNLVSIGDNETPALAGPVNLGFGRTAVEVAAGAVHTCARLDNDAVRCFGFGGDGRLGYGNTEGIGNDESPAAAGPVDLGTGRTARTITAGRAHTCAVLDDGTVRCWGYGFDGRLGYGTGDSIGNDELPGSVPPVMLGAGRTAVAISAGDAHTCALLDDANVRCWGYGANGQLGHGGAGNIGDNEQPTAIGTVSLGSGRTAVALTAGDFHTCAVLDDGNVRCWGYGGNGRLGYGNTASIGIDQVPGAVAPVDLGAGRTAKAITAGDAHTCALLDNGSVRCWGNASSGQLGYGNRATIGDNELPGSVEPVQLGAGRTAVTIAAGGDHTCAKLDDATTRCWGRGVNGELGLCSAQAIGDDESPATAGTVDLGVPGVGGTDCPAAVVPPPPPPPPPPPAPPAVTVRPPPPPTAADPLDEAMRLQERRLAGYRACRATVTRQARVERATARRRFGTSQRRVLALRAIATRAAGRRDRCRSAHRRAPGRVTSLSSRTTSRTVVVVGFKAPGTDGSKMPAARGYLVKQSLRPIRTSADFDRAPALCKGTCAVDVTRPGADISIRITDLRRRTTYYYAVAARDNVTAQRGPRSKTVQAKTR